jgi:hypothetical protein
MIYSWWKHFPKMGMLLFYSIICECDTKGVFDLCNKTNIDKNILYTPHQNGYGCFKDIKYFCRYVLKKYSSRQEKYEPIIGFAITWLNQRLYNDYTEFIKNGTYPSLACKWIPREKSKYGWIFKKMAIQGANVMTPEILKTVPIDNYELYYNSIHYSISFDNMKAVTKCNMNYRKVVSCLTKIVDIPEYKQCNKTWSDINPEKITLDAFFRKSNAFLNVDNTFDYREKTILNADRRNCSHNVKEFLFKKKYYS